MELRKLPEPAYRFRHALVQEAAYKGLLRDQRRRLHAQAAWGLEEFASDNLEEVAAVLGHHYAMARETERAAHYRLYAFEWGELVRILGGFGRDGQVTPPA